MIKSLSIAVHDGDTWKHIIKGRLFVSDKNKRNHTVMHTLREIDMKYLKPYNCVQIICISLE